MPIVRSCREEGGVRISARNSNGAGNLRVYGIPRSAGWCCVMSLIQYEEGSWLEGPKPIRQRAGIGLVNEHSVRNQEAGVGRPRIDAKAAFTPNCLQVVLVYYYKRQSEASTQLVLTEGASMAGTRLQSRGLSCAAGVHRQSARPQSFFRDPRRLR